jgi:hypothetical protein
METDDKVGRKGRFYLTKHIWMPQEPAENLNRKMSDMILRHMPKLPLGGEDAIRLFPVLAELRKSHDKIKADLQYRGLVRLRILAKLRQIYPNLDQTNCTDVMATVFKNLGNVMQWVDENGVHIANDEPVIRDALLSELRMVLCADQTRSTVSMAG